MFKRLSLVLLTVLLVLLTACSSSSPKPSEEAVTTKNSDSNESVTITWWDYITGDLEIEIKAVIADYSKAHPNVTIERLYIPFADLKNKITIGAAAEQLPDIIIMDNPDHQAFAAAGFLADITEEINEW